MWAGYYPLLVLNIWLGATNVKATGGVRGPKTILSLSERSHWAVKDFEDRIKNIVPSPSYVFWKSQFACNYSTHENLKLWYPQTALMYLLEKTTHPKLLKLGLYPSWVSIYRSDEGIWEILFFGLKTAQKWRTYWIFELSGPIISEKSKISQIPSSDL